jgi:hypothetical protein
MPFRIIVSPFQLIKCLQFGLLFVVFFVPDMTIHHLGVGVLRRLTILPSHCAIEDGLVETGIPQVDIDQLNNCHSLMSADVMTWEQFDSWFSNLPCCFYEIVNEGGVLNFTTESQKLTRRTLLKQDAWKDWEESEHLQLDQYKKQFMFGEPCKPTKKSAVFNLIWT